MRILTIIFLALFVLFMLFGKVTVKGVRNHNLILKIPMGIIWAFVFTLIIGLPILGIISLL